MTGACCAGAHALGYKGGRPVGRRARVFRAVGSMLPGALLLVLPKCPLCLAAWLAATTGFGLSAAVVAHARGFIVGLWILTLALAAVQLLRRRRSPAS